MKTEQYPGITEDAVTGDKRRRWSVTYISHDVEYVFVGYCATWGEVQDRMVYGLAQGVREVTVEVES